MNPRFGEGSAGFLISGVSVMRVPSQIVSVGPSLSIEGPRLTTSLCERAREDAFNQMLEHAGRLGANAVIGVRYDATEIAPGITEVLCYGTAVYVEAENH